MNLAGLPAVPTIRRLADETIWVFPAQHGYLGGHTPAEQARLALAGPFRDRWAAGLWIVEHLEGQLTLPQRTLWAEALQLAGGADAHYGQLVYLLAVIRMGKPAAYVRRCAGGVVDRKQRAAGEAA